MLRTRVEEEIVAEGGLMGLTVGARGRGRVVCQWAGKGGGGRKREKGGDVLLCYPFLFGYDSVFEDFFRG